jgi:hypothetical protein
MALFAEYMRSTPGTESGRRVTVLLGEDSAPQPDLLLRIAPEFGGQSQTSDDDYIEGTGRTDRRGGRGR